MNDAMEVSATATNQQLSPDERQLLAREVAADGFDAGEDLIEFECQECGVRDDVEGVALVVIRDAVKYGWDAALEYMKREAERGKIELEPAPRP